MRATGAGQDPSCVGPRLDLEMLAVTAVGESQARGCLLGIFGQGWRVVDPVGFVGGEDESQCC